MKQWSPVYQSTTKAVKYRDAFRIQFAKRLIHLPRVLIDMSKDPVCPWEGMRFFHGSRGGKYLQTIPVHSAEGVNANAPSTSQVILVVECWVRTHGESINSLWRKNEEVFTNITHCPTLTLALYIRLEPLAEKI